MVMSQTNAPAFDSGLVLSALGEARDVLLSRGTPRRYDARQAIFVRGDPGDSMLLIEEGVAEVSITSPQGRKSVLDHAATGQIVGEIAVLDGGARSADVTALTEVRGLSLSRNLVMRTLRDHPDAMLAMIAQLAARARNASDMFETQAMPDAGARLAMVLLRLADKWGEDALAPGGRPLSQSELGDYVGLTRENVNRRLKAWARDGVISLEGGRVTIRDADALRDILEWGGDRLR
jgi:CRP/FNR family cyclic AMP-dependent transcriptional regulator